MFENMSQEEARKEIFAIITEYYQMFQSQERTFQPGDPIRYAEKIHDEHELINLVDSSLEFWLTAGRFTRQLETALKEYLGVSYVGLVNSGSSANLIAFMALTSPLLEKERRIFPGDEVITVAAAFPTTVAPIVQFGAVPVFVDIHIPSYNIDVKMLEAARTDRTKAVMLAHTLGNPFNLKEVKAFCDRYQLWLIEDNCDALGAEYQIDGIYKKTGTIGDIGTSSFYPAHHMTMGEGGAVYTNHEVLYRAMMSFRDWGRDCRCPGGQDNLCNHRFDGQYGQLPRGYDHKYVYSHFGYNLKITDLQAAIGCAQIQKLPGFVEKRRENFSYLYNKLMQFSDIFLLPETDNSAKASWFGFPITVKQKNKRGDIIQALEYNKIQTRMLFSGNILRHPCFNEIRENGEGYRVVGEMKNADRTLYDTFWFGLHPGMSTEMMDFIVEVIKKAL